MTHLTPEARRLSISVWQVGVLDSIGSTRPPASIDLAVAASGLEGEGEASCAVSVTGHAAVNVTVKKRSGARSVG